MRLHLTSFCYLAMFMTCVLGDETLKDQGSTPGQDPAPDSSQEVVDRCAVPPEIAPLTREDLLWSDAYDCISNQSETTDPNPTTLEGYREAIKAQCRRNTRVRECFDDLTRDVSKPCTNHTQRYYFAIHVENHEIGLEVVCEDDGEKLAVVAYEVLRGNKRAVRCVDGVAVRNLRKDENVFSKIYEEIVAMRQCLIDLYPDHEDTSSGIYKAKQLVDEYLSKMKCISPDSGKVLCSVLGTPAERYMKLQDPYRICT